MNRTVSRRLALRNILSRQTISSQARLAELLKTRGFNVTQATVSRDLRAVGAVKTRTADGTLRYVWEPDSGFDQTQALASTLQTYLISIQTSGNLVVAMTPPGAAQVVAAAVDRAELEGILGTVAGDDTVLVVASEETGGSEVEQLLKKIGEGI
ncbi:MAG: arginine repressor [Acidimicrobiia bacterium]|nr:arginine repressor [bacterium]MXZ06821.1 arginine repressor [Acidimicrobiia bacterium]MCY3579506.1 arginine repressor [bacterium]MCY3652250.1 arginine repressor [bacterium]MYF26307.1 arginine repressor [Acidimicrobiia bacterium]